jgi:hypothetical protein
VTRRPAPAAISLRLAASVAVALLCPLRVALAWGHEGHVVIALIAEHSLTIFLAFSTQLTIFGIPRESMAGDRPDHSSYLIVKLSMLAAVPPAFVTSISPVVAPAGIVAAILPALSTLNAALTPLKVTRVMPRR